tara:strand:- start:1158 stop:1478 length:321 start_codon:yes stop_codon:yes gene_type:complete
MSEKEGLEKGEASIIVSLYEGRLSVTSGQVATTYGILIEREMFDGEWDELWAMLKGTNRVVELDDEVKRLREIEQEWLMMWATLEELNLVADVRKNMTEHGWEDEK